MTQERVAERRASRAAFRYPERRTGFDRRRPSDPLRMLLEQPFLLVGILLALNVLSAADWLLTTYALSHGAVEANTVLSALIGASPLAAGMFKAAMTLLVTGLIWRARRFRLVLATAAGATVLYAVLIVYHVAGLATIHVL